ncbi:P-II family nitrogen regulator [Longimicrobium sp.]|uniref:P-II family nitrogen regulator n=1 Tax=Longimicrobium sp. TaxID=2029185 RepID=UPI003B3A9FA0
MQLLIAVINQEERIEEILSGFLEIGITGATLINTEGMGRLLSSEVPIFAGLEALAGRTRPRNQTLFSVMDDAKVDAALALLQEVCGDFGQPATGIVVTLPVNRVLGLKAELAGG